MTVLIKAASEIKSTLSKEERPLGFIPTMGALHDGHISLIKAAREECKTVVVSIFVNPLQFAPNEDFKKYPRSLENDLKICKENKVDYVFAPDEKEIYPDDNSKKELIEPPKELTEILCGKTRIGHFQGVATVIKKLFDIIQPDYAYFGEKDLQQLYIIKWLVKKYNSPIFIRLCPTVRESSGLAFSSRNQYLTPEQKKVAANIYESLKSAKYNIRIGIFTVSKAILESLVYLSQFSEIKVEYFEARDKDTLAKTDEGKRKGFYYFIAAKVGNVRLIDNLEV